MFNFILSKAALLAAALLPLVAAANAAPMQRDADFVTQRQIETGGGVVFQLEPGVRAEIVRVKAPNKGGKACRVHLPSVRKQALKARKGTAAGITFPVPLGVHWDPNSAHLPSCNGPGKDCIVFVVVH